MTFTKGCIEKIISKWLTIYLEVILNFNNLVKIPCNLIPQSQLKKEEWQIEVILLSNSDIFRSWTSEITQSQRLTKCCFVSGVYLKNSNSNKVRNLIIVDFFFHFLKISRFTKVNNNRRSKNRTRMYIAQNPDKTGAGKAEMHQVASVNQGKL